MNLGFIVIALRMNDSYPPKQVKMRFIEFLQLFLSSSIGRDRDFGPKGDLLRL